MLIKLLDYYKIINHFTFISLSTSTENHWKIDMNSSKVLLLFIIYIKKKVIRYFINILGTFTRIVLAYNEQKYCLKTIV